MSGDVFGNGMLLSRAHPAGRRLRPPAHLHRPRARTRRPRSPSAAGCSSCRVPAGPTTTPSLLSSGGGIFPRTAKSIPVNAHVRAALGIEAGVAKLTPADLMKAILKAPVDLLWNGGIGTYVKSSTESNADVGDKANDADPGQRRRSARQGRRRGRQPGPDPARPHRVRRRGGGRQDQHRRHRQQRGRGHLRPRGEHQDPAQRSGHRGRHDRQAAQQAARGDDRRGRRARPAQQLRAEHRDSPTPSPSPRTCSTPSSASCAAWSARGTWTAPWSSCPPTGRSVSC